MDEHEIDQLLERIEEKANSEAFEDSFTKLYELSEKHPEKLYSRWDQFVEYLSNSNQYRRFLGIFILPNLVKIDTENKFELIFDQYFDILYEKRLIVAGSLSKIAWKVVEHKPHLEPKVTAKLLAVDKSKAKYKDSLKIGVMQSLTHYYEQARDKAKIIQFVQQFPQWQSPKAQKLAKAFLKQWDNKPK